MPAKITPEKLISFPLEIVEPVNHINRNSEPQNSIVQPVGEDSASEFQLSNEHKKGLFLRDSLNVMLESISSSKIDPRVQHEFELLIRQMGGVQNILSYYDWENAIYVHILRFNDITEAQAKAATKLLFKIIGHHFR